MIHKTLGCLILLSCLPPLASAETPESRHPITIRAVEGLQFSPPRAKMEPGQKIVFRFLNRDPNDQPHNLIIAKPGSLADIQNASLEITPESISRGYVPEHDAVIKATKLLTADQSEEFYFTAPEEPGVYYYICTYPGHATLMYGALYVGAKWGPIAKDPNISPITRDRIIRMSKAKAHVDRPTVRRTFMKHVGPAAIAVALDHNMNYCWDAGNCRLRYAWSGDFIDTGDLTRSNGNSQASILGKEFWNGQGDDTTYSVKIGTNTDKPDFKGYRLIDGQPEFKYLINDVEVTEYLTSTTTGLVNLVKISGATEPVTLYTQGNINSSVGQRDGDFTIVQPEESAEIILTIPAN